MKAPIYAVFSGGGVKATAFVGALHEAEKHVTFLGVGGTSAGSIVATMIACGYTAAEIEEALFKADYKALFKVNKSTVVGFAIKKALKQNAGLLDSTPLLRWLRSLIEAKVPVANSTTRRVCFADLRRKSTIALKIVATNITTQDIRVFGGPKDDDVEVASAVLASCSFPFLFPPVQMGSDLLLDGGVMSNFPMWLFDEERGQQAHRTATLGFAVLPKAGSNESDGYRGQISSLFEAVQVAQDRVQERYLLTSRLADVIRIRIPPTSTFDTKQTDEHRSRLIDIGRLSAQEYFKNAPMAYGDRIGRPPRPNLPQVNDQSSDSALLEVLSLIVRDHIVNGGVARDPGWTEKRSFVRFYVDLMEASTISAKRKILALILKAKIKALNLPFERIVGLKNGNIILCAEIAEQMQTPLLVVKSDLSYKMGPPFEGEFNEGERVILVDDVASDASMLLVAIRQLHAHRIQVLNVVTLIERIEGDAQQELHAHGHYLEPVCRISDTDIKALVEKSTHLPGSITNCKPTPQAGRTDEASTSA